MIDKVKPLIEMKEIIKAYNIGLESEIEILHGIDLKIYEGEFVAIVGESGSGKSTLMNIIGVLDKQTKGEYYLDGIDIKNANESEMNVIRNKKIGFVFQNFKAIDIMKSTIFGVNQKFNDISMTKLFGRGGINEVSSTVITIIFIGCLVGIINECESFKNLLHKIQEGIKGSRQLCVTVFAVSLGIGFVTGAQLLAIILPISIFLPLFEKFGLKNKNITRIVEATGTVGITLVPWSVPGIFIANTLGVEMNRVIPYLFFPITVMAVNLLLNITGIGVSKIENRRSTGKYVKIFNMSK